MDLQRVSVIGAGQMGGGIAQVAAQAGYQVFLLDTTEERVQAGLERIGSLLSRSVEKGKLSAEEREAILGRITPTTDLAVAGQDADLVIEAVVEKWR